jgi:3-oxoadipate enol-lactonase
LSAVPKLEREGIQISYEDSGSGPPIVLMHSFLCSGEMWRAQAVRLAEDNRVVNIDLRGHGRSGASATPFDLYDLVDDVTAVMDSLGIDRAVWAGLSVGGMASLRAALVAPERVAGLVLVDTHAGTERPLRRLKYRFMAVIARHFGLSPVVPAISRMMFGASTRRRDPKLVADWEEKFRAADVPSMLEYASALLSRDSVLGRLADISVPTLVIVGEEDTSLPRRYSDEIAAGIPGAKLVVVPSAGHLSALEQPDIVTDEMHGFLASLQR